MKRIFALVILMALLFPSGSLAQGDLKLSQVQVDIWPEYDQAGQVLVIYHITLPPQVLPVDLNLRIPGSVNSPHAVAARQADGTLINIPHQEQKSGEWTQVSLRATTPETRVEYYDPGLDKQGASRSFTYQWPGDYAVDSMVIQVQQPFKATNMSISPSLGQGVAANDNLTYYSADVGALPAGQVFKIEVKYQKAGDEPSINNLPVQPSGPIDEATPGRTSTLLTVLPWVLGGLGVLLIVGGGLWYWLSGRDKGQPERRVRHKPRPAAQRESAATAPVEGFVYCHQCGNRAAPGDRFCRTCGTQLRTG